MRSDRRMKFARTMRRATRVQEMYVHEFAGWATIIIFVVFFVMLYGATLRFGPRRGYWNQPAAVLRRPGSRLCVALYGVGALHVVLGLGAVLFIPGAGVSLLVVCTLTAGFYVMLGLVMRLASSRVLMRSAAWVSHAAAEAPAEA